MGEHEGVHQFDNVIIGKFRGPDGELRSFSRELNTAERRSLNSRPDLLQEPALLLERLTSSDAAAELTSGRDPEPSQLTGRES